MIFGRDQGICDYLLKERCLRARDTKCPGRICSRIQKEQGKRLKVLIRQVSVMRKAVWN